MDPNYMKLSQTIIDIVFSRTLIQGSSQVVDVFLLPSPLGEMAMQISILMQF